MKEIYRFRILEEFCQQLVPVPKTSLVGNDVRVLDLSPDDPRVDQIRKMVDTNDGLVYSMFDVIRSYSEDEVKNALLARIVIEPRFRPTGEECGTVFDETHVCPFCGFGRIQLSDLHLDLRRIPNKRRLLATFAGETVVTRELREEIEKARLTGVSFRPVHDGIGPVEACYSLEDFEAGAELLRKAKMLCIDQKSWEFTTWLNRLENKELLESIEIEQQKRYTRRRKPVEEDGYFQLIVTCKPVKVVAPTRFGVRPWDRDPTEDLCPLGHNYGYDLLSEVHIDRHTYDGSDFIISERMMGTGGGLFVPEPILMVSIKALSFLKEHCPKAFTFHSLVRAES